jgi:osmotically-inducible protein OsmY
VSTDDAPAEYLIEHVREALAADPRVNELGLQVAVRSGKVFVSGVVSTTERHDAVAAVVSERAPGWDVHNGTTVAPFTEPLEAEPL